MLFDSGFVSIVALRKAAEIGVYGSEFDENVTSEVFQSLIMMIIFREL